MTHREREREKWRRAVYNTYSTTTGALSSAARARSRAWHFAGRQYRHPNDAPFFATMATMIIFFSSAPSTRFRFRYPRMRVYYKYQRFCLIDSGSYNYIISLFLDTQQIVRIYLPLLFELRNISSFSSKPSVSLNPKPVASPHVSINLHTPRARRHLSLSRTHTQKFKSPRLSTLGSLPSPRIAHILARASTHTQTRRHYIPL